MMMKKQTILYRFRTYDIKKGPDLNLPPPGPLFVAMPLIHHPGSSPNRMSFLLC